MSSPGQNAPRTELEASSPTLKASSTKLRGSSMGLSSLTHEAKSAVGEARSSIDEASSSVDEAKSPTRAAKGPAADARDLTNGALTSIADESAGSAGRLCASSRSAVSPPRPRHVAASPSVCCRNLPNGACAPGIHARLRSVRSGPADCARSDANSTSGRVRTDTRAASRTGARTLVMRAVARPMFIPHRILTRQAPVRSRPPAS